MATAVAILAAGKGTRLRSQRPKVLHTVGGKALLLHVIDAARAVVPASDIYVIIGHQAALVRAAVENTGVRFIEQREQKGTGHAIAAALPSLAAYDDLLVLSGDVPLLTGGTVAALHRFHTERSGTMTVLSAVVEDPFGYGRIVRAGAGLDEVERIVEQKSLAPGEDKIREINSGIYAFALPPLRAGIGGLRANNTQGELYLTDMAAILRASGGRVLAQAAPSADEVLGANTIAEMMVLDGALRRQIAAHHMAAGVTIFQPETVVIDAGVQIGPDTIIEPFAQLLGTTRVGSGTRIRSFSVLEDMRVGDAVLIRQGSILAGSVVGDGAVLGPYAHLRPESQVGDGAHVGNFVELKKTRMGARAKANHLAYLGDTEIGEGANIGAGTIVCNYDGVRKHDTVIGAGAFVGSNAVLVAPVSVGEGAYIAAASCITGDVPADALGLGRSRQVNKPGWAAKRRAARAAGRTNQAEDQPEVSE